MLSDAYPYVRQVLDLRDALDQYHYYTTDENLERAELAAAMFLLVAGGRAATLVGEHVAAHRKRFTFPPDGGEMILEVLNPKENEP